MNFRENTLEVFPVSRDNREVIGITEIVFHVQTMLHKLIKFIQVHVREELGSQVPDRYPLSVAVAPHDGFYEPERVLIRDALFNYRKKNLMIHGVKEFPNIALEDITGFGSVSRNSSYRFLEGSHSPVGPVAHTAGKGSRDECLLKDRVQYGEHSMMDNAVSDGGFVDMALFRIVDIKTLIRTVYISLVSKLTMKQKDIFFECHFEHLNIALAELPAPEFIPSSKEVLGRNHPLEKVDIYFHCS